MSDPTYPYKVGTAITNTIYGLTAAAANDLASQLLQSYSFTDTAETLEIKNLTGAVVGTIYYNRSKSGTFELIKLATGGMTNDAPGQTLTIPIKGASAVVEIQQVSESGSNTDVVKVTYSWVYKPAVTY
jgi:hypothetical protein